MKETRKSPLAVILICLAVGVIAGLVRNLTDLPGTPVLLGGIAVTTVILIVLRGHAANMVVYCVGAVIMELVLRH